MYVVRTGQAIIDTEVMAMTVYLRLQKALVLSRSAAARLNELAAAAPDEQTGSELGSAAAVLEETADALGEQLEFAAAEEPSYTGGGRE
jgi:hypothetical protein